jgi:hypothetical protein
VAIATFAPIGLAQQGGPYKVLKTARVGGEGGWDYIYADVAGRRLYIPRRGTPATPDVQTRLTIFNLDTLEPIGEIAGVGGNGTAVGPKSGHGFTSSKPVSMFDGPAPPPTSRRRSRAPGHTGTRFVYDSDDRQVRAKPFSSYYGIAENRARSDMASFTARYRSCLKALRQSRSFFVPPLLETAVVDTLRTAGAEDSLCWEAN